MPNFHKQRIIGRIAKALLTLLIIAVNATILWRVFFSAAIPKSIKTISANETLQAAYAQYGTDLTLQYQDLSSVTRAESNAGYFGIPKCVFIEQANQVQIVFRYNNSTLRHLKEDYNLEETPTRDGEYFDISLVKTTDLTPDNLDDNDDETKLVFERFFPTGTAARETTTLYTYYRYTFDNITVEDDTAGIFIDCYYVNDIHYDENAYGTLCIYYNQLDWISYKLTSADKSALAD